MANKLKTKEIFRKNFSLGAGTTPVEVDPSVMPSGLIRGFWVKLESSAITGFTAAVADFQKVLNSFTYGAAFPQFTVMNGMPGKFWDAVFTNLMRRALPRTTPTANGFAVMFYLPYAWPGTDRHQALRTKDTALLNINGKAQPFIKLLLDSYTTLSGGATACDVTVVIEADYDPTVRPGFVNSQDSTKSGDQPGRYLEIARDRISDLAIEYEKPLLTGGTRECIGVIARELSAAGVEVSNTFTKGVATPSRYVFKVGDSDAYNEGQSLNLMDDESDARFGIAPQAGYHYWMANRHGHMVDNLSLRGGPRFTLSLNNVATVANVLELMQINTLDLPADVLAIHAQQLGAAPAAA